MDFSSLLNTSLDNAAFDAPKPLPVGQYRSTIGGHKYGQSDRKQTDFAEFEVTISYPEGDSVDPDQLTEFGDVSGKTMKHTLWFTEKTTNMARQFLVDVCGIQGNMSLSQAIEETTGREIIIDIVHETIQRDDGTSYVVAKIGKCLAAS